MGLPLTTHGSSCWGGQALKQPSTHVFNTATAYFRHVCHAKCYRKWQCQGCSLEPPYFALVISKLSDFDGMVKKANYKLFIRGE